MFHPKKVGFVGGFTLIELLVVIAIIGILSSVVLGSLNTARAKGNDSAIKSNLNGVRTSAEIYFDDHQYKYLTSGTVVNGACPDNATTNMLADSNIKNAIAAATTQSGGNDDTTNNIYTNTYCYVSSTTWAMAIRLRTALDSETATDPVIDGADAWCIDSSGQAKEYSYVVGDTVANAVDATHKCK